MIRMRNDVRQALETRGAVVALESTLISHGLPHPENIDTATMVETIIRDAGAVPATIGIVDGAIVIGLTVEEMRLLATSPSVIKVSKRDIAYAVSQKLPGATTVSATSLLAAQSGIQVFATGGIGGVHRGADKSFDISRDLEDIAVTDMAIVCAGVKSVLDIPATLEYLETKGVELIGYKTLTLPAFYAADSPYVCPYRLDTPDDIAALMRCKWSLGISGGIIVANPLPKKYALPYDEMEEHILKALKKAKRARIRGKDETPYLLREIALISRQKSLRANIELIKNNARLAADIAIAFARGANA